MDKQPICNQTNCKLIISSNLEKKISVCCRELPENEWSGTLFYSIVSGKFGKDLVLKAEDFYLKDNRITDNRLQTYKPHRCL